MPRRERNPTLTGNKNVQLVLPESTVSNDIPSVREQLNGYFAALPPASRKAMKAIRAAIRAAAPTAVESFGYGIPGFRLDGRVLIYYAAWKQHTSLYPIGTAILRAHAAAVKGYVASNKGTLQFPLVDPVPEALVTRLVKARIAEVKAASTTASQKKASKKPRPSSSTAAAARRAKPRR